MGIAFSKQGDTAQSLTHDILGYNDEDFAQKLWQQNAPFSCRRLGVAGRFAPGYAVWVPEANHPMGPNAASLQMTHFDALMPQALESLAAAQAYHLNPQILLGAHEMVCRLNYSYLKMRAKVSDDPAEQSSYLDQAASFAIASSHTGLDVRKKGAEAVHDKIENSIKPC